MFTKPTAFGRSEPVARRDTAALPTAGARAPGAERSATMTTTTNNPPASASSASPAPVSVGSEEKGAEGSAEKRAEKLGAAHLIVGPEVKLKGAEILDCDTLVVEGRVEATMDSRLIRIAERGSFAGTVSIDVAEIHGRFEGELTARSQLIIHSTGRVSGTIRFGKLVVAEGGELNGEISVISGSIALPLPARAAGEVVLAASASAA